MFAILSRLRPWWRRAVRRGGSRYRPALEWLERRIVPSTFVVSRTADDASAGSLRWAIAQANSSPGADTIDFQIAGGGVRTIALQSGLPNVTGPVLIDGTSQTGYNGAPLIQLDGSGAGSGADGLLITANNTTVLGLVISHFGNDGIAIIGGSGDVIQGCYVGTNAAGTAAAGNGRYGVGVYGSATGNLVGTNGDGVNDAAERNVISGNASVGVVVADGGTTQNVVAGNYIGTDVTGTKAIGNGGAGVDIFNSASANRIGVSDRDAAPADDRNLVSGNNGSGVAGIVIFGSGTSQNIVAGNYVGTDVTGTKALGNGGVGVFIQGGAASNRIGTNGDGVNDAAEANVIAANAYQGIAIDGSGCNQNVVAGNFIGVDATGGAVLGNGNNGIWVLQGAASNRIGAKGTDADPAGEGNVIGGNANSGVLITDAGSNQNSVAGNFIGTDPTGTKDLGNGGSGVDIGNTAQKNTIGGSAALGNVIAFNRYVGVAVTDPATTGNPIRGNSIFSNTRLGIDLGADGVTLNHIGDTLAGPNNLQNYPVIASASPGGTTTVSGTLNSAASSTFTLDFYASAAPDEQYFGDGQRYLGSATVTTDAAGNASFALTLSAATSASEWLTATATDALGDTSEFSAARQLPAAALTLNSASWTPLGPAPVSGLYGQEDAGPVTGRVDVAAPDPSNANVMYLAGNDGGVWKTTNWLSANPTWTPLTDQQPSLAGGEHDLVVFPGNTQIVYAAPAGPNGCILKSTDGGATWNSLAGGLFGPASFGALVVDPTNANTLYAAVNGGITGGVYKSTDGGQTWTSTITASATDLVIDPTNPSVLYAGLNGGGTNGVYKTTNGGLTWIPLTNGIGSGATANFIRLALAPSATQTVYATVFDPSQATAAFPYGVPVRYQTTNGGAGWSKLPALPNLEEARTWHVMLAVEPTNANHVWVNADHGVYFSANGGQSWGVPLFGEDPVGGYFDAAGGFVMVGDRGIHRTADHGLTWLPSKQGNLQVTEFYDITLDPTNPNVVYGISQDHLAGLKFTGGTVWTYVNGGSGETGKILVDPANPTRLYDYDPLSTVSFIHRSDDGGATWIDKGTGIDVSQNGFNLAYAAQKAFVIDPANHLRLIVGTDQVYESTNGANTWTARGGVLSAGQFISAVAIAPSLGSTLYASTTDGRFFASANDGGSWTEIDSGLPRGAASSIIVDPASPQHVFATLAGSVWTTANGGATWTNLHGNYPANFWTNSIIADWRFSTPVLYLGGARGVYRSLDLGTTWTPFGQGMPNVNVTDLEFVPGLDLLAAGTYGRGVFEIRAPGPATHLGLSAPGNVVAGTPFSIAVQALDAAGYVAPSYAGTVQFASSDSGPGRALPGNYTFIASDGGAHTFTNAVTLVTTGSQTVTATDTGTASIAGSATVSVSISAPDHLAFQVQPTSAVAGVAVSPGVQVEVLDHFGNLLTGDNTDQVTLTVATGPGGLTTGSTVTATASGGIATFTNLVLDTAGAYTLGATATGGLTGPNSSSFTIRAAAADHLAFRAQPGTQVAGQAGSAVKVQVLDQFGNLLVADNTDQVTLSIAGGPGGFTAGSATTVTVASGVAVFTNLVLNTAGSYTLADSATGSLAGANSGAFTVSPAAANHLGFVAPPADTVAGAALHPAVAVQLFDRFGNLLTGDNTDTVTMAVATGPAGFAAGSTVAANVSGGVATFTNLVFNTVGGYTLGATATGGIAGPASTSFAITPTSADHPVFRVSPGNAIAGAALNPAVQAALVDRFGNLLAGDNSDTITLTVASGPADFTSGSTTTATVSSGVATFANLVLDTAGSYTLGEAAVGHAGASSGSFTIAPAAADHLAFGVQPGTALLGQPLSPAVTVLVRDAFGNLVTGDNTDQVTLTLASGPGSFTGGSTSTVTVSGGVATFGNVALTAGGTYALGATATGGLTGPNSASFLVQAPDHLAFVAPPGDTSAGQKLNPAVTLQVLDAAGNLVVADNTDQVTLTVASGPGGFAAGSTVTATASGGVATFANLVLNTVGGYTLGATATGGLTGPTSHSFAVNPATADHLGFSTPPSDAAAGNALNPAVQVKVLDQYGNWLSGDNAGQVTLTVASGPGAFANGSVTVANITGGVAAFGSLLLDTAGSYKLAASATGGLSSPSSGSFTIRPAGADHLGFSTQPTDTAAGSSISPAVQVKLFDPYGNLVVADNTDVVTLTVASGPGSFTTASTVTATASSGSASFTNLVLDTAGSYTLGATATGGLRGPASNSFAVLPAAPDHLGFSTPPSASAAGAALQPLVQVKVFDAYGNWVTGDNHDQVTLAVASGPGHFTSDSTTTAGVNGGVATFTNLVFHTVGSYTLGESTAGGLSGPASAAFAIRAGTPAQLVFLQQPVTTGYGAAFDPAVQVAVTDSYGNIETGDNQSQVQLSFTSNPTGATLAGAANPGTASAGVVTFAGLAVNTVGRAYQLLAQSGNLSQRGSAAFDVTPRDTSLAAAAALAAYSTTAQTVHLSAAVSTVDGSVVVDHGTVTFTVLNGSTPLGSPVSGAVVAGAAAADFTVPAGTPAASYTIDAVYSGLPDFTGSEDATGALTVQPAATTTTAAAAAVPFSDSAQNVPLTATVSSPAGTVNVGTIVFALFNGAQPVGSAVSSSVQNGTASATYRLPAATPAGSYTIHASFSAANFAAGSDTSQAVTVNRRAATTTAADAAVTFSESAQDVSVSATVTSPAGTVSEGTETFTLLAGAQVVGSPVTVNVQGGTASARYPLPAALAGGRYTLQAVYNGSANLLGASDGTHAVTVNAASTTTTAAVAGATFQTTDQTVALSATVTSPAGTVSDGTATFTVISGATVIGSPVAVAVHGSAAQASYALPGGTAAGSYVIRVAYSGTVSLATSTDASHSLTVSAAATTTAAASAVVDYKPVSQTVNLSAAVTSPGGLVGEGTVTFTLRSPNGVVGSPVTVNVQGGTAGAAYVLPARLLGGRYTLDAEYSGTANSLASADMSSSLTVRTGPPISHVLPLPANSFPSFLVSWSGQDAPGGAGIATYTVLVSDNGGPFAPFVQNTAQTAAVYAGALNHRYAFYSLATDRAGNVETKSAAEAGTQTPVLPDAVSESEDTVAPPAIALAPLLTGHVGIDPDPSPISGVAVTALTGNGTWQWNNGAGWLPIATVTPTSALLLPSTARVRFTPAPLWTGPAGLLYVAWDGSLGTAGGRANATRAGAGSAFSAGAGVITVNVTAINHAPTWSTSAVALTPVPPGVANPGTTVQQAFGSVFRDVDANPPGIAVSRAPTSTGGAWQYSTDGNQWTPLGTVAPNHALLLPGTDWLRFLPTSPTFTGTVTLQVQAWDGTQGSPGQSVDLTARGATGGTSAFSAATLNVTLSVQPLVNHAPTWSPTSVALTGPGHSAGVLVLPVETADPPGLPVAAIVGPAFHDADGNPAGLAVVGTGGNGSWQFSTDGSTWLALSASPNAALLLTAADFVRFVPDPTFIGTATLQARAWDGTLGSAGATIDLSVRGATGGSTAFSASVLTAAGSANAVNDAPTWSGATAALPPALPGSTPAGASVAVLFGSLFHDLEGAAVGIAITRTTASAAQGVWQYSPDGTTWLPVGAVAPTAALLLTGDDLLRLLPAAGFTGGATLQARGWDGFTGTAEATADTSRTGGATAFSTGVVTLSSVAASAAPSWAGTSATVMPQLTPVLPGDSQPPGDRVDAIFGPFFQDAHRGVAPGIAVTAVAATAAQGAWQYFDGSHWQPIAPLPSHQALLLSAGARLRFVPHAGFLGTVTLTAYAWDGSGGLSGTFSAVHGAAFSSTTLTATCLVNTGPTLTP